MIFEEFESAIVKRYRGEAEATDAEKKEVGGRREYTIENHLFQDNALAQAMAETLLARFKGIKRYYEAPTESCPIPIELDDTITVQEKISDAYQAAHPFGDENKKFGDPTRLFYPEGTILVHTGIVRSIKISVTPTSQIMTFVLEVDDD